MDTVDLRIDQPTHEQVFEGSGWGEFVNVTMQGQILSARHGSAPLFLKWYSSIGGEVGAAENISGQLTVGSHVITFTAQDKSDASVPDDQLAELYQSIEHIGMAGGPPDFVDNPCLIHVFIANMLAPDETISELSKSAPVLEAQVPIQWANYNPDSVPQYEGLNPDYHALNRIRYRWLLRQVSPSTGPQIELDLQDGDALVLIPSSDAEGEKVPKLHYTGALPGAVVVGEDYEVTLRVEDVDDSSIGNQVSRTVEITA